MPLTTLFFTYFSYPSKLNENIFGETASCSFTILKNCLCKHGLKTWYNMESLDRSCTVKIGISRSCTIKIGISRSCTVKIGILRSCTVKIGISRSCTVKIGILSYLLVCSLFVVSVFNGFTLCRLYLNTLLLVSVYCWIVGT